MPPKSQKINLLDVKYPVILGNGQEIKNQIVFVTAKATPTELKLFINSELKLDKNDKFKVGSMQQEKKGKINYLIIINIQKLELINELMEEIVAQIGSLIKKINKPFYLNLDLVKLTTANKALLEDLFVYNLYTFMNYKSENKNKFQLIIQDSNRDIDQFNIFQTCLYQTRDLINDIPSKITPEYFSHNIKEKFQKNPQIKIIEFKGKELQKKGLHGIYSVGKGADDIEPTLIIIQYIGNPKNQKFKFGLVGKGICYDSGGYNLKPSGSLENMKIDMGGAACVLGVINYFIQTKFAENIICALPLAMNLVSDESMLPGDIIKMYNKKTVEIMNTDAEGRFLLADALSYLDKNYSPNYLFDIATLTGAQGVALGKKITALLGNNQQLNHKIQKLSWEIKERVWELPMYTPYFQDYKSEIADMQNSSKTKGGPGTIGAALFLSQFVICKKWAHLDIATSIGNAAGYDETFGFGGNGFGMRLLIKLIEKL